MNPRFLRNRLRFEPHPRAAQAALFSLRYARREWDSNPRYAFTYTRFPSVLLKPLGHLSKKGPSLAQLLKGYKIELPTPVKSRGNQLNNMKGKEIVLGKTMHKLFATILLAGFLFICPSCNKTSPATPDQQKPLILVSIAPYQYLISRIAGDDFSVQTVVPAGSNPHAYEPTVKQISGITRGKIWFLIGEPFEKKILSVLNEKDPSLIQFDLREGIDLLNDETFSCNDPSHVDHFDRHIWLSPKLIASQTEKMATALAECFPEHMGTFLQNGKILAEDLLKLDGEIAELLNDAKGRVFLVSHPAFGYFCRDYHLQQLSIEFEGKEARPRHLDEIVQKAIAEHAELAFALPQHNNKGAQIIAEKLHVPVRMIDPYSPQYFDMLLLLAHLIADPQYQQ